MAVQIDNIDSEIEIVPRATSAQAQPSAPATSTATAAATSRDLRGLVVQTLEEELQAFLRSRG